MYQYIGWITGIVYAEHEIKSEAHRLLTAKYPSYLIKRFAEFSDKEREQLRTPIYPEPLYLIKSRN